MNRQHVLFFTLGVFAVSNALGQDLRGLHPRPPAIAGIGDWQIEQQAPRGTVYSIDWNKTNNRVATIENVSGIIRIYDPKTWRLTGIMHNSTDNTALAWSPDGSKLATSYQGKALRIWNSDGTVVSTFHGHEQSVRAIAWGPAGKRLVSAGYDNQVIGWRDDGAMIFAGKKHTAEVESIDWIPGGQLIATGSADQTARIWHVPRDDEEEQQPSIQLDPGGGRVRVVRWSPDGNFLATGDDQGHVRIWKPDGKLAWKFGQSTRIAGLTWSPNSKRLATTDHNCVIVWSREGDRLFRLSGPFYGTDRLAWSPDGNTLVASINQGPIWAWDMRTRKGSEVLRGHVTSSTVSRPVQWTMDSKILTMGSRDHAIRFWSSDGKPGALWPVPGRFLWDVAISPDNKDIATFSFGVRGVRLWNLDGKNERVLTDRGLWSAWSANGKKIACTNQSRELLILDRSGKTLGSSKGLKVAWSPNGQWLVAVDRKDSRLVKSDGTEERVLKGHTTEIDGMPSWHPMGHRFATIEREGTALVWNSKGELEMTLAKHRNQGAGIAFSPDGKWIASSSTDLHFSTTEGVFDSSVPGLGAVVRHLQWSPDSTWLAAQIYRESVRLFKPNGAIGPILRGKNLSPRSATWSPDGQQIACSTVNRTLMVWDAKTGEIQWIGVQLRSGKPGTVSRTGKLIDTDAAEFDKEFVFVEKMKDGSIQIHTADEFAKLTSTP